MYKCTDCGKEYKDKPPFCECGNNNFEEIGIITAPAKKETNKKITKENSEEIQPQPQIPTEPKKDYTYIILSCILGLCIILIITGVFHLKSISKKDAKPIETQPAQTQTAMPIVPSQEQKKEQTPNPPKNQVFTFSFGNEQQNNQEKIKEQPKQTQKTDTKKTQPLNKKTTAEPKKQTKTPVKQTQTQTKLPKITQTQSQPVQKQTQAQKNTPQVQVQTQAQKPLQSRQNTQTQKLGLSLPADKTLTQTPKVNTAEMKKELLQYKIALRNRISSDIDFTKVIGDGKCVITFKINSAGKLTNRAFATQSDNDSLNDAVYSAVMKNPAYNPPPSGYKNETLHLTVKIYGGRFEVDLS